ncbi:hypothetical protein BOTNAR_0658g00040 [Botryotinia narcissicola]|uniref:Uncharacterized protein n=1 Tax=Botryotinia narcissicola TaxID=278944 RepID=A0A4Z1HKM7_9HELO|nr:hypothetical protein BOTNAR_0658g00040 [Botryotinia narcissicola]
MALSIFGRPFFQVLIDILYAYFERSGAHDKNTTCKQQQIERISKWFYGTRCSTAGPRDYPESSASPQLHV